MKNILEEIAARTRERIAKEKTCISVSELENRIQEVNKNAGKRITLLQALQKDGMSYICEVKKASPSKGIIAEDFPYLTIAEEYEAAGAAAISVLTEPFYFQGDDNHDIENTILTINKVTKNYSPWSSKIYTLRETPHKK